MNKVVKSLPIEDRIKPIGFRDSDGIKLSLYGKSGSGKTTLWATWPGPILALVCSGGQQPGELRSVDTPEYRKKISQLTIEKTEDIAQAIELQKREKRFNTIVLDHASGLQDLALKEILGLDELPPQLSWGLASQQQYGQLAMCVKEFLRSILNLSCHVIIVAQERNFNEGEGGDVLIPYVGSALTPSITGWLNAACDYIGQTFIRNKTVQKTTEIGGKKVTQTIKTKDVEYCLRTSPDPIYMTKFRLPRGSKQLPEVIVDPSYDKIMQLIKSGGMP